MYHLNVAKACGKHLESPTPCCVQVAINLVKLNIQASQPMPSTAAKQTGSHFANAQTQLRTRIHMVLESKDLIARRRFLPGLGTSGVDHPLRTARAEANDHEIIILIEDLVQLPAQGLKACFIHLDTKDRELEPLSATLEDRVGAMPALRVPDVVADQVPMIILSHLA